MYIYASRQYIEDESMDKKKEKYSTADWKLINVKVHDTFFFFVVKYAHLQLF